MNNLKKILFTLSLLTVSLCGLHPAKAEANLNDYYKEYPYLGLIADEITYGHVTVWNVHINHHKKFAVVKPGQKITGTLKYKIDAEQDEFNLYHLVVGIEGVGAQDCIAHTYNMWDSKSKGTFTLKAPEKQGVYEVRFLFHEGYTCAQARDSWNKGEDPSSSATIGIIIVK